MNVDDDDLREMLARRSERGQAPHASQLVSAATSAPRPRGTFASGIAELGGMAGVGLAALCAVILIGLAVSGSRFGPTPSPRPAASSAPAPSPSADSASPLVVVPREAEGTAVQVRQVQAPAVRWGSRYGACVTDTRDRTVVALTDAGALDRWSAYVVLPVPGGNSLFRCDVAVAGDALIVLTLADPDGREQAWLVSAAGARELAWTSSGFGRMRGFGDRVVAVKSGESVVEIDRAGIVNSWNMPEAEPRVAEIEDAAVDALGRRWLLGRPNEGNAPTVLWVSDGSSWRAIEFPGPPGFTGELWLVGTQNPGPVLPVWDDTRGSTILRAVTADAPWERVDLPAGSLPVGVLGSGRLVTQQMTWLRVERDPARVCRQGDAPCFRWATLLAGLDAPVGPDDRRFVRVAGEDVVVTDRHGVRVTPTSSAFAALSDAQDRRPLPTTPAGPDQIALTFRDRTGIVTARAAFVPPYDASMPDRAVVVNKEGLGRVLWVTWTTWHCERQPTVEFTRVGEEYTVKVNTGPHPSGGCDTINGSFAVELRLSRSVDAEFVRTVFENPPP